MVSPLIIKKSGEDVSDKAPETPDEDRPDARDPLTPQQQPPGYYQVPPGHDPWSAYRDPQQGMPGHDPYGAPGYPPAGYGGPGYQLPAGYYAGPDDPLVSADFAGWWRRSFGLLSVAWQPMVQVQLLWAIPLVVAGVFATLYTPDQTVTFNSTTPPDFSETFEPLLLVLPFTLIAVLLTVIAQLATLDVLVQRATGRPVSAGQALLAGLRRFPAMLGWQIVAGLVVLLGFVLCFLPGFYAAIVFLILPPIILLERGAGVGRAFRLFHADFGASVARIATVVGVYLGFIVIEAIFTAILSPTTGAVTALSVAGAVLSAMFSVATGVVVSPLILTAYADMRARHEPFSTAYLVPHPGTN